MKTYTPETAGEMNKRLILKTIRDYGPLSRADICRLLPLSFPSVSTNVNDLLEEGLVEIAGGGDNTVGRRSTLLRFNAEHGYVVGISLGRYGVESILCDLCGNSVQELKTSNDYRFQTKNDIQNCILTLSRKLLRTSGISREKVACVCVSIPGAFDNDTGRLSMHSYLPELTRTDLESILRVAFGKADILFENNVNCGALGEQLKGAGRNYRDIFYIHYGTGIGGAAILGGNLYRGFHSAAGEIGYMLPGINYYRAGFRTEGAMESVLSGQALLSVFQENAQESDIEHLFRAYEEGQPDIVEMFNRLFSHFGLLLVNITAMLDPQIIIVSGEVGRRVFSYACDLWKKALADHVPYVPKLVCSEMKDMENLYGAVNIALSHLEKDEETS